MDRARIGAMAVAMVCLVACRSAAEIRPASRFPYEDDLSFRGFAEEALLGHATQRTHRFDDYTKGSYHVDPREVAEGLWKIAPDYSQDLDAVVVVGPYGPLWAFDVITTMRAGHCARVNWLLMPHARITVKRTGCIPAAVVSQFLAAVDELAPSEAPAGDGDSCVVVSRAAGSLRWSPSGCYATESGDRAEIERLERAMERLMKGLELTYSGYPPVDPADP